MATINEIKEQMTVVQSVGGFTNALQQIATIRMVKLRGQVLASRPFVEAANAMLTELISLRNALQDEELLKLEKKNREELEKLRPGATAVIVITSNQGLTGRYNIEIFQKVETVLEKEKGSDFYVIGSKGQEYFQTGHFKVKNFPYIVPDNFSIADLQRLIRLFDYYTHVTLIYSRYVNSATREVVTLSVVNPLPQEDEEAAKQPGKYIFEPDINQLIDTISRTLRAALFQQEIFDARLAQFSAQMIGMKTASDNANTLLADLRV
ncbi:F0F1 ATP synthase subunit gamma, partial [Patescibacteria group bacterium]|nr:F0F1 ATP synthase subunit gamma [Patescibacteria group bacterium]